ncbi:MAG: ATP-dependent DNA helicase RecG [Ruminococcaceae bacterium]|nr:ATP-dependent DNA helicase RecG [Oscillospiraceae bacterium]
MKLSDSIQFVKGIGEARAKLFARLGIHTAGDLLFHLPRTLEDRTQTKPIAELMDGETVGVCASLAGGVKSYRSRGRLSVTQATVSDGENMMKVTWFNAPYVSKTLSSGSEFIFFGKASYKGSSFEMVNPVVEVFDGENKKTGRLLPVYPSTAGLSQTHIRNAAEKILDGLTELPKDILPSKLCDKMSFPPLYSALKELHLPKSAESFEAARQRLAFEEFFILQTGIHTLGEERKKFRAVPINDVKCIADFAKALPFELTNAQKRVINEISADLKKNSPMNRLVQGDVGSGKTMVAAAAMYAVAKSGYQATLMAPTEILAAQHYKNLKSLFEKFGFETVLLSGGMSAAEKRESLKKIKDGTAQIIVGTHALISDSVTFKNPALVITDEQHRFGVRQRTLLTEKGYGAHTLVMTATPIPRTLSLILYGDLDISVIDELPPGRKPIETYSVAEHTRQRLYKFITQKITEGRQVYIICPLIEESEALAAKSAVEYAEKLKKTSFKAFSVEVMHGKIKTVERKEIMERFARGEIDILVATTVVEVGVDVPNATVMVIENAERFGLSQLHQLRGRIGRGEHQSYCIMFSEGGKIADERMKIMCKTNDGFKISEKDLELRGPGEFFGVRQHGLPELKCANLASDMELLVRAKDGVRELLAADPNLEKPEHLALKNRVRERFAEVGENGILN